MPGFKLTLEYDGTDFAGWQAQREGQRTVQTTLEEALARVSGRPVRVVGAGRTDSGVHAEGQVAGIRLDTDLTPEILARALNAQLPGDLAVVGAERAQEGFHARRDARAKLYRYVIWNGPQRSPLRERRSHRAPGPLDPGAMAEAALAFEGTRDFKSLQASGSSVTGTVRTLWRVEVTGKAEGEIRLEVEGSGFLRHMVRNLAGTLLEVGRGRRPPGSMGALLEARDRRLAGPTAPARGLTLVRVDY